MPYFNIHDITHSARSVRVFDTSQKIGAEVLEHLVDCARLTPSAANRQPLKYRLCHDETEVSALLPLTRWAGFIKDKKFPPEGKGPTGFIVICHDKTICEISNHSMMDVGIAAQTINLAARERGFACCMIASFDAEAAAELLMLPRTCVPVLVIALGTPAETPIICSIGEDGDTKYFRDKADLHFVPKRSLKDVLLK